MNVKRWVILVSFILLVTLVACSNDDESDNESKDTGDTETTATKADTDTEDEAEPVDISIWHNFAGNDLRAQTVRDMIDEFNKEHPDINVHSEAIPVDGYRERISTVAAADKLPDVFITYAGSFTDEFYKGGLIQPITPILEKYPDWKAGFLDGALEAYDYEGDIYSVPVAMSATSFFYYNKKIFAENDKEVPKTWNEFIDLIDYFNDQGITPLAMGNKAPWVAQSTTFGAIADRVTGTNWFFDAIDNKGPTFTDDVFIDALNKFNELLEHHAYPEGVNSMDNTQAQQYFAQGKAAMMINGSWTISALSASASDEFLQNVGVTTIPAIKTGEGAGNTITGGAGGGYLLSASTTGPEKEAALELIYALSDADAQKRIAESDSMVMYDVDIDEDAVNPLFYKAFNLLSDVKFAPVYDLYMTSQTAEAVNNGLQELMIDGDVETVAKKIQQAHESTSD